jgi:hypothetical protein
LTKIPFSAIFSYSIIGQDAVIQGRSLAPGILSDQPDRIAPSQPETKGRKHMNDILYRIALIITALCFSYFVYSMMKVPRKDIWLEALLGAGMVYNFGFAIMAKHGMPAPYAAAAAALFTFPVSVIIFVVVRYLRRPRIQRIRPKTVRKE